MMLLSRLIFGTAGLRGLIGVGTNRINEVVVRKITLGYANYLNKNYKNLVLQSLMIIDFIQREACIYCC